MSTHIIPWIAARTLFPSLPPDPRQSDQHDQDGCPNEIDGCGCAAVDSQDPWLYRTFTRSVPVRAEQDGPGKPWRAVVTLPDDSVYRRRVVLALASIRRSSVSLGGSLMDGDPAWIAITLEIMDAEDRQAPWTYPSSGKVEVCRRRRPVQADSVELVPGDEDPSKMLWHISWVGSSVSDGLARLPPGYYPADEDEGRSAECVVALIPADTPRGAEAEAVRRVAREQGWPFA